MTARNKRLMREALTRGRVAPARASRSFGQDAARARAGNELALPVVIKPLLCSASRGVMRADDEALRGGVAAAAGAAAERRRCAPSRIPTAQRILVEAFVPGAEVALEGLLRDGALTALALFDKPDPLDGPFFEETIYVTPSRHPPDAAARDRRGDGARRARRIGPARTGRCTPSCGSRRRAAW